MDLAALADQIPPLDEAAMAAALARQDRLTKPAGALGKLEGLSVWLAGVQAVSPPKPLARKRLVVLAGDHGIAAHGVSAYPAEVTRQMVGNFLAGGAACNVLARQAGVTVRVLDIAVGAETPVESHKVRRGSGAIDREPALTRAEAERAFATGLAIADEEVDAGADLLVVGDMGIGNTTVSATIVCALTGAEPVEAVGRGTGVDDAAWSRKVRAVRDALRRAQPATLEPLDVLAEVGGADFAAAAGLLLGAARRRTPVLLDGLMSGAAALVAQRIAPAVVAYLAAGHRSTEPAHALALDALGLRPLLDLDLRLGEGTGALLAVPLLDSAVAILGEMATFDEAGVSDR